MRSSSFTCVWDIRVTIITKIINIINSKDPHYNIYNMDFISKSPFQFSSGFLNCANKCKIYLVKSQFVISSLQNMSPFNVVMNGLILISIKVEGDKV